jgi:alpha-tubulin suppressor-like RCC1 family protein
MLEKILYLCLCLVIFFTGCFWQQNSAGPAMAQNETLLPPQATANLKIVIKDSRALSAALRGQATAEAMFTLKLLNYGNVSQPFTLMRKKAEISNSQATVTFTAVPAVTAIAGLELSGANISGETLFHGGIDLGAGDNTVVLVASGSGELEDVLVQAAFSSASDFSTMQSISAALFANLNTVSQSLPAADRLSADKVFNAYKAWLPTLKVAGLSAGGRHSMILREDGTFAAFGNNAFGQLGKSGTSRELERKFVAFNQKVTQIAAGNDFSVFLANDGKVYATGNNESGQLGVSPDTIELSAYPLLIPGLSGMVAVGAKAANAWALDAAGNLYGWGSNFEGQLGLGRQSAFELPQLIAASVKQAAFGANFCLLVKNDGTVWGAGNNQAAQMAADLGDRSLQFVQIAGLSNIEQLSAGDLHCLALNTEKKVYAWAGNFSGQTGLGSTEPAIASPTLITGLANASQVFAGKNHSLVLDTGGKVFGAGSSEFKQLGSPGSSASMLELTNVSGVSLLSVGADHNLAFTTDTLSWGANDAGQLGNGQTSDTGLAVPAARSFTW